MQEYIVKIDDNGTKFWYQNGKRHRLDGPAVEYSDGTKFWYQNGKLHRLDGPATEWSNGDKVWYINDKEYTKRAYNAEIKRLSAPPVREMTVAEIEAALGYAVKVVRG